MPEKLSICYQASLLKIGTIFMPDFGMEFYALTDCL